MSDTKILEVEVFNSHVNAWQNGTIFDILDNHDSKSFNVKVE